MTATATTQAPPRTGLGRRAYAQLQLFLRAPYRPAFEPFEPDRCPREPLAIEPTPPTDVTVPPLTRDQVDVIVAHEYAHRTGWPSSYAVLAARHVPAVAQLLDEVRPRWFAEVDVATLDLASPTRCVLGQLYPSFMRGICVLESYLLERHREALPLYHATSGVASTSVWVAEVENRRAADRRREARAGTRVTG